MTITKYPTDLRLGDRIIVPGTNMTSEPITFIHSTTATTLIELGGIRTMQFANTSTIQTAA